MRIFTSEDIEALKCCMTRPVGDIYPKHLPVETRYLHVRHPEDPKILSVCHVDTVQKLSDTLTYSKRKRTLYGTGFDDRLGYWILTHLLDKIGCPCDLLICDHEEEGKSTAQYFHGGDYYNWIVEFDRGGEDVVDYGQADDDLQADLKDAGFKIGWGSFSDICFMNTSTAAFNVGIGYHKAHSVASECNVDELYRQIDRFSTFYHRYKGVKYRAPKPTTSYSSWFSDWSYGSSKGGKTVGVTDYSDDYDTTYFGNDFPCDHCGGDIIGGVYKATDPGHKAGILYICEGCVSDMQEMGYDVEYFAEA